MSDEADEEQYHFVDLPVGRIRYARHGDGREPLLLIHGFGGDLDNWVLNLDAFDDIATTYALDLPGHGQSTRNMPPVEGLAETVLAFMDKLDLKQAHVVGHSLGGLVAILMAKRQPYRLKSLMLICSAGLGPGLNDDYLLSFIAAEDRDTMRPVLQKLFADPERLSEPMMEEYLAYKRGDGVKTALQALHDDIVVDGRQRRILADDVRALKLPVHAVHAKLDAIIPPRHSFLLRNAIKVTIVPKAGHMVQMEKHKTINALVREQVAGSQAFKR